MTYKIGVELEILNITANEVKEAVESVGSHFDGYFGWHQGGLATGWKAERDSSLSQHPATYNEKGAIEVISRPLKGKAGIREMRRLTTALKRRGATVDKSCGTHITFGLDENARFNRMSQAKKMSVKDEIVATYMHFQNVFDAISPNNRQVNDHVGTRQNSYCREANRTDRYASVNTSKYIMHGVIEFRQPGYTLSGEKIEQWIKILNAIVSAATNENHVSKSMVLSEQPVTIEAMCKYLNIRNTTEEWMVNRVTDLATTYTGGRQNRLNVLAASSESGNFSGWC